MATLTHCELDKSIQRVKVADMAFPLGVYPIETVEPRQGYSMEFEAADAGTGGEWEEWPDRYVFEAIITSERLKPLCRSLFNLLPLRVFPIMDVIGHDAFREIDPYIAYDLVGLDRYLDSVQRYGNFLYEDGLCGFGAMCDDPFAYFFLDEHKVITVRTPPEQRDATERIFQAFDLAQIAEPAGADAAAHEHRGVLYAPEDRPDLLIAEEIVERVCEEWQLTLNIDMESNLDDEGEELGISRWRCLVRAFADTEQAKYIELLCHASSFRRVEDMAIATSSDLLVRLDVAFEDLTLVSADRLSEAQEQELFERLKQQGETPGNIPKTPSEGHVIVARVLGS